MPPKSSSKKAVITWFTCDKCNVHITSKDRDSHEKHCPIGEDNHKLDFIKNSTLFTTNLEKKSFEIEELSDIPAKHLNNLIFISEGAIKLCSFHIGQHVTVSWPENPEMAEVVRRIWPVPGKFLSTVFTSEDDYELNWKSSKGSQVKIQKLSSDPAPLKEITLKFVDGSSIENDAISEITKILKNQMRNQVFCAGNRVHLNFYNKKLEFSVKGFQVQFDEKKDSNASLEDAFDALSIGTEYGIVFNSTNVVIEVDKKVKNEMTGKSLVKTTKADVGGLDEQLKLIEESLNIALGLQKIPSGVKISRGALLFGPSGCGKSMICDAISHEVHAQVVRVNTSEIFSKFLGETEKNLQQYFDLAVRNHPKPSLIIIENVNNLCPKYETNEVVKRVSVAFLNILDGLHSKEGADKIFILATTDNIDNLNPAVRRCGRLDNEIEISAPNPQARLEVLQRQLSKVEHDLSSDEVRDISNVTHGYVGSDLCNLVYNAALKSANEGRNRLRADDINQALTIVKPSAMREVLIESPNVKWDDIGGQSDLKLKLKQAIEWPLLYPEKFEKLGIKPPRGILMYGPPGCSKTMIAKALATESSVNFLSIKGPELFSMWVGESERAVREVFRKARQVAPSIIFFDEIDAIGGERSSDSSSSVKERVLTQLLTELDGVDALKNVTIVAATNRPDMIDKALLRPGRIDRIVYVGLPDEDTRREIFRIKLKKMPLAQDVTLEDLVKRTNGYSGAEIQAVCHEAALKTLEESFESTEVYWRHFEHALTLVQPRTSRELLKLYDEYSKKS